MRLPKTFGGNACESKLHLFHELGFKLSKANKINITNKCWFISCNKVKYVIFTKYVKILKKRDLKVDFSIFLNKIIQ